RRSPSARRRRPRDGRERPCRRRRGNGEVPVAARPGARPQSRRGRTARLPLLPHLLGVLLARLSRVRDRPRDADDGLAAAALQPLEPRRRRLPGKSAFVILAGVLSPIENALAWLLEHLHDSVGLSWGWSIIALTVIVRI